MQPSKTGLRRLLWTLTAFIVVGCTPGRVPQIANLLPTETPAPAMSTPVPPSPSPTGSTSPATNRSPSTPTGVIKSPSGRKLAELPIAIPIVSPQLAAYFNQVARPDDIAIIPARGASRMYSMITVGQKLALFTSWADAERQFDGLPSGTSIIGYDPEHWDQTPLDEQQDLPATVEKAESFAHAHGMKLLIAPDRRFDDEFLNVLAPHADIIVFQGQRLQDNPDGFASWAHDQIRVARAANPRLEIFIQVGAPRGPATQMMTALHGIDGDFDGIAAWTNQQTISTLQDFVTQVRARPS